MCINLAAKSLLSAVDLNEINAKPKLRFCKVPEMFIVLLHLHNFSDSPHASRFYDHQV